ncbi:MAG: hypothetical protein QXP70_05800 [Methanomassiliicoccales archaeon]
MHSGRAAYLKLLNSVNYYRTDVLIIGADITGKLLVPIIEAHDGYRYTYRGRNETVEVSRLQKVRDALQDEGVYTSVVSQEEYESIRNQPEKIDALFRKAMAETLESWAKLAQERLSPKGIRVIVNFGNDDRRDLDEHINDIENDSFVFAEDRIITLGDTYQLISTGYANKTPWDAPRDVTEEELAVIIEKKVEPLQSFDTAIFNFHCPPYDTPLDRAVMLDPDGKLRGGAGHSRTAPVGSTAVRKAIEKYQPLLGLHGHIHESRGYCKIGRTVCLNPGSEYQNGVLKFCLIVLDGSSVKRYNFIDG